MSAPMADPAACSYGFRWPPFALGLLPPQVQDFVGECQRLPFRPRTPQAPAAPLITVVVPTYEPNPTEFSQLLLSLDQQTDQDYALVVVDDGSRDPAWLACLGRLAERPATRVIRREQNRGVSAATNIGVEAAGSPYIALVDQDDLLHPRTIELIGRTLRQEGEQIRFLYSDHVVFDDAGTLCQYIPKFPWNPEALPAFNYLIHLTVMARDLYLASGGLNSDHDGIQDWELYLRLCSELRPDSVRYLPLPLYFWRQSSTSQARSSRPLAQLRSKAEGFVQAYLDRRGHGESIDRLRSPSEHYFFSITTPPQNGEPPPPYRALVHADARSSEAEIRHSLAGLRQVSPCPAEVIVVREAAGPDPASAGPWPFRLTLASPGELRPTELGNQPLLYLWAGVRPDPASSLEAQLRLLGRRPGVDILAGAVFDEEAGLCLHAGFYACGRHRGRRLSMAYGQGVREEEFRANFGSFAHRRPLDLPPPQGFLVNRGFAAAFLGQLRDAAGAGPAGAAPDPARRQFLRLTAQQRCLFVPDLLLRQGHGAVPESPFLLHGEEEEGWRRLPREPIGIPPLEPIARLAPTGPSQAAWPPSYVHPLFLCGPWRDFLPAAFLPRDLAALLRRTPRRGLVILIPTELNPRSNGHACLLHLALDLQAAGAEVCLLPVTPYRFFRQYFPKLMPLYQGLRFIAHPLEAPGGSLLLVPESIRSADVRRARRHFDAVLWWNLAPAGVLTSFMPAFRQGDLATFFSPFALPAQPRYHFLQPPLHGDLLHRARQHRPLPPATNRILLYTGKGRLKPLSRKLHRRLLSCSIELITRSHPATKTELIELLGASRGLISFDPMTNLSLEAAVAGLPVYLPSTAFPESAYADFPVDLRGFLHTSAEEFLQHLAGGTGPGGLPLGGLMEAHRSSIQSFLLMLSQPVYAASFQLSPPLLEAIRAYRRQLLRSGTIQAALEGEAASAALKGLYVKTLKAPYAYHRALCLLLGGIDAVAEFLHSLRLFRPLQPVLRKLGRLGRTLLTPAARLGRALPR